MGLYARLRRGRSTFSSEADVRDAFSLPVLAVIPLLGTDPSPSPPNRGSSLTWLRVLVAILAALVLWSLKA